MGVPALFKFLITHYKRDILFMKRNLHIDNLYIDANCLIHPCCYRVLKKYPDWYDVEWIEKKMIKEVINYLNYVLAFVKPKHLLYIAIDGPAPIAKQKQQRTRRFKAAKDRQNINKIKKKYSKKREKQWNNTKITPGTEFLQRVELAIYDYIIKQKETYLKDIKVIFSGSNVPEEGEHKLYQHIRNLLNKQLTCCIYGLDADLIFLSLASELDNIYLVREKDYIDNKEGIEYSRLVYMDISKLKMYLIKEISAIMTNRYILEMEIDTNNFVNDFIVYSFLLGNDFLPHLPSLKIRQNGIPILMEQYVLTYMELNEPLVLKDKSEINKKFLNKLIVNLGEIEENTFIMMATNVRRPRKQEFNNKLDEELHKYNMAPTVYYKTPEDLKELCGDETTDPIMLGTKGYRERYYNHYFGKHDKRSITQICNEFYNGINWVFKYYFDKCPSFIWYYKFTHSPLISDMATNIKNLNFKKFRLGKPTKPYEQLLMVIPPQSYELLPKSYRHLVFDDESPIIEYYPITFEEDFLHKTFRWEGIPLINYVSINKVRQSIKGLKLSNDEKERNKIKDNKIFD